MSTKKYLWAAVLCLTAGLAQAAPASKASVEKLFEVQNFDKMMDDTAKAMPAAATASIQQFLPEVPAAKRKQVNEIINRYLTDFSKHLSNQEIRSEIRRVAIAGAQKVYTQEEVDALIDFSSSPVGRSINAKMPQYLEATMTPLMTVIQAETQKFQQQNGLKMQREINRVICGKNTCK
ncbi:hypothetical protein BV913_01480 [Neisseria dumasiana]|uniref:DUF2059 domain-containing protein n=1 Tax=Neisseria dumasiana TaxID=1931275 RepID=A0ABX3WQH8_9NEIS|nr:hypothetical protein BV913_01480 [Neisseria dumasiana]